MSRGSAFFASVEGMKRVNGTIIPSGTGRQDEEGPNPIIVKLVAATLRRSMIARPVHFSDQVERKALIESHDSDLPYVTEFLPSYTK